VSLHGLEENAEPEPADQTAGHPLPIFEGGEPS